MKIIIEIDVPDDVKALFLDKGIKEKDVDEYLKLLLSKTCQSLLNSFSEAFTALKSGVISPQEYIDKMFVKGANVGDEIRRKYEEEKKASDKEK